MSSPTKAAAWHTFWSQFGLAAYEENAVPHDAEMPRLTYSFYSSSFDRGETVQHVSLFYHSDSWADANELTETISETIGRGGVIIPCKGGAIWIKRGEPFSQSMSDADDDHIRRKYINVTAEFLTAN